MIILDTWKTLATLLLRLRLMGRQKSTIVKSSPEQRRRLAVQSAATEPNASVSFAYELVYNLAKPAYTSSVTLRPSSSSSCVGASAASFSPLARAAAGCGDRGGELVV